MDSYYIEERLKELGVYASFRHRMEYRRLAQALPDGRTISAASGGLFRGRRWLVFALDDGWYFISAHPVMGVETMAIPLDKLGSVSARRGLLFGSVTFTLDGTEERIVNMHKDSASLFAVSAAGGRGAGA